MRMWPAVDGHAIRSRTRFRPAWRDRFRRDAPGIIHYIDRVCISKARPSRTRWSDHPDRVCRRRVIQEDLKLDDTQMGYVFSAFTLAYALFEIPGGWLGDKWGPRRVLLRIVMFWSFFTAATGYAWNQMSMMVCRFLFGAGEAGGFPNIAKMFSVWLPQGEHGMAQGITWLAARWGGAFTPLLVVWVLGMVSWRMTFVIFAFLGVVWAVLFALWFRDNPKDHPRVNAAELALLEDAQKNLGGGHAKIPWGRLFATRSVLLLWLYYFCISYVWYFYITWLPKFMEAKDGLNMDMAASSTSILNGLPLFLGGIGCFIGGLAAKKLAVKARPHQCGEAHGRRAGGCWQQACSSWWPRRRKTRSMRCWRWACPAFSMISRCRGPGERAWTSAESSPAPSPAA
jgi:ACS family glucarate transporter-like MFS transporter